MTLSYSPRGIEHIKPLLSRVAESGKPIVLKGDPDPDGLFAWLLAYQFLSEAGFEVSMATVNRDRAHGIVPAELDGTGISPVFLRPPQLLFSEPHTYPTGSLLVMVDAGISADEMEALLSRGINVLVLDHHDISDEDSLPRYQEHASGAVGVHINNQYSDESSDWRFLSGAGIVACSLSRAFGIDITHEQIAMVGITLLSDVRTLDTDHARSILETTFVLPLVKTTILKHICQEAQSHTSERFQHSLVSLDRTFIDFVLSPFINAAFQLNLGLPLFRMVLGSSGCLPDVKSDRRRILDDIVERIQVDYWLGGSRVSETDLDPSVGRLADFLVLSLNLDAIPLSPLKLQYGYTETSFLGLVANKFLDRARVVFIRADGGSGFRRGSVRSQVTGPWLPLFRRLGFEVGGHLGAFGVLSPTDLPMESVASAVSAVLVRLGDGSHAGVVSQVTELPSLVEFRGIAQGNAYRLSQDYVRLDMSALPWSLERETPGMLFFTVGGYQIRCFNKEWSPSTALVLPTWEEGRLVLTLDAPI